MTLNPEQFNEQLRMFAPAHELKEAIDTGAIHTSDNVVGGSTQSHGGFSPTKPIPLSQMWRIKRREAEWEGTARSVREEGVKTPVHIHHLSEEDVANPGSIWEETRAGAHLWNGHHRIIAAFDKDPNTEVPIVHTNEETHSADVKRMFSAAKKGSIKSLGY